MGLFKNLANQAVVCIGVQKNVFSIMVKKSVVGLTGLLLFTYSLTAQSAPLNLDLTLFDPNLTFNFATSTYDASTDILSISGFAITLASSTASQSISGNLSLSAEISAGGELVVGANSWLSITGTTTGAVTNATSGTLLTGDLTGFGFSNGSEVLEFIFSPTGGDLASFYVPGNGNGDGGIIISATGYDGNDFNSSFSGESFGTFGTVAPIPVPTAAWLFGSAILGLWGSRARLF